MREIRQGAVRSATTAGASTATAALMAARIVVWVNPVGGLGTDLRVNFNSRSRNIVRIDGGKVVVRVAVVRVPVMAGLGTMLDFGSLAGWVTVRLSKATTSNKGKDQRAYDFSVHALRS